MATEAIEVVETPPVEPPAPVAQADGVPDTYDLKLPEGSTVDAAIVERTAAKARALGLSNDAGQKLLDTEVADAVTREKTLTAKIASERTAASTKAIEDLQTAWAPGGAERTKRDAEWKAQAQKDPDVVGSTVTPEAFQQAVEKGQQALKKYGSPELEGLLVDSGFAFHPKVMGFLAKIGKAMAESSMATNGSPTGTGPKSTVNLLYGKSTPEPE
jgi:hypothetical protein